MSRGIRPEALSAAIEQELTMWHQDIVDRVNDAGSQAIEKLVKLTKASAPKGRRKRKGRFRGSITSEEKIGVGGVKTFVWGVKAPNYRLTHLIVHGHAKAGGGRTRGNSFLADAMAVVLPEYEDAVREAVER